MARALVMVVVLLSLVATALGFSAPPQLRTRRRVQAPPAMVLPGTGLESTAVSAAVSELPQLVTALTTAERMEDLGHRCDLDEGQNPGRHHARDVRSAPRAPPPTQPPGPVLTLNAPSRSAITVAFIGPYIAYYTYLKFTGQGTDRPGEGTGIKRPPRTKKAKR
mmetsp:Transcript_2116/g.4585  ORF Transcript_2116/g.4585 Transcript_2116/m.4585 type:complete len:164 (+) Transcript_2116:132-623(+)